MEINLIYIKLDTIYFSSFFSSLFLSKYKMESTCFWALLSVKDLEFIHTSTLNKLKGVSLFDLFHPNEVLLAKRDLYKFIDSNLLGGSVTR
jgi:hypothetical protein